MTKTEFWQKCKDFDWNYVNSMDVNEFLDGHADFLGLKAIAVQHGPEFEAILQKFRDATHPGHKIPECHL